MESVSSTRNLLRLTGVMGVGIGAAWALQVIGFGGSTAIGTLAWVLAAAAIAGGGVGLIYTALSLQSAETSTPLRFR